jgi:hypothetical protein
MRPTSHPDQRKSKEQCISVHGADAHSARNASTIALGTFREWKGLSKKGQVFPSGTNRDRRGLRPGRDKPATCGYRRLSTQVVFWTLGEQASERSALGGSATPACASADVGLGPLPSDALGGKDPRHFLCDASSGGSFPGFLILSESQGGRG